MTSVSNKQLQHLGGAWLIGFLSLHGLLFIGGGYAVSFSNPWFSILHSGIGILVYMIFLAVAFQKHFLFAFLGAAITMLLGFFFGDFFLEYFYFGAAKNSLGHRIYASMVVFYLYLFFDLIFYTFFRKKA